MVVLAIGFTACEGDQGEIGPIGNDGTQGEQGVPGDQGGQGDQGDQGVAGQDGSTEAQSFGNVALTVSGVDMHGDDFTEIVDFKYLPYNDAGNSVWYIDGNDNKHFYIRREFKVVAKTNGRPSSSGNTLDFSFSEVDGELVLDYSNFSANIITGNSLLYINGEVDTEDMEDKGFTVTNYSYNAATGAVKFDFTYSYLGYNEEMIEISGNVNVIVYEAQPG